MSGAEFSLGSSLGRADELVSVGAVLLADKLQSVFDALVGRPAVDAADIAMLPNLLHKVEKVQLVDRFAHGRSTTGTLYITTTHVIFVGDAAASEIWLLHGHIGSVERASLTAAGAPLTIKCKHFLRLSLVMTRDKECQAAYETLSQLSSPVNIEDVFAFSYVPVSKELHCAPDWPLDVLELEYGRMGIPNERWVVSHMNRDYQYCETYPEALVVPASAPPQVLVGSSRFRSRGRLPVLAYLHRSSGACICRCSQPLSGFSARCVEDEALMQHILRANANSDILYVIDTRPKVNQMVNKAQGKGFEDERNYANIRFHFFNIENIHTMRSSLQKLVDVAQKPASAAQFAGGVEASGWLRHVRVVVESGAFVAQQVARGVSAVVHCSDGWDRTAQTVSLASLLLDPFYRTIRGFQALIEKDWLKFGYKFTDRCGHVGGVSGAEEDSATATSNSGASREQSPVFTQFLDCVWQLMVQFPLAFEFSERFLIEIHDHVYACQFGTFLGNCDKDRQDLRLSQRTRSLWTYMLQRTADYRNALYCPIDYGDCLEPDVRPQAIRYWRSLYNRFDVGVHARESVADVGDAFVEHAAVLEKHLHFLQARIAEMRTNKKNLTSTSVMVDSGHSSSLADETQRGADDAAGADESGVDEGAATPPRAPPVAPPPAVAVRWQSLRSASVCTDCQLGFSLTDRKAARDARPLANGRRSGPLLQVWPHLLPPLPWRNDESSRSD